MLLAAVVVGLVVRHAWMAAFGPGSTKEETARILVHDLKFGGRAKQRAIGYGDGILPLIQNESGDFTKLNGRNSFWIAEVLGALETDQSRKVLNDLYSRTNSIARLTGAVGLAQHGALPEDITEQSFLVRTVQSDANQTETHLAIIALGRSKAPAALPCLLDLLRKPAADYWHHAYACAAVARIGHKDAVPVLRDCLASSDFHALSEAFRALITLGDKEAVPLAISRVSPELKNYNSGFVVKELKKVTRKSYGYDREDWQRWWNSVKEGWQIPEEFRKSWDEQKHRY